MTGKLYLHSDSLTAIATVLASEPDEDGRFRTVLAETLFHPQGGGQPGDIGTIGEAEVLATLQEPEGIVHLTDRPLSAGPHPVAVNAQLRQINTRMHSAGHLIAAVGEALGWQAVKGNHRPGEGRIVFTAPQETLSPPDERQFTLDVNALVARALPREQGVEAGIRRITWGELPLYTCGGTHVANTREVGEVTIGGVKLRKGQLSVSYSLTHEAC